MICYTVTKCASRALQAPAIRRAASQVAVCCHMPVHKGDVSQLRTYASSRSGNNKGSDSGGGEDDGGDSPFAYAAPPRLDPAAQAEWEELQRRAGVLMAGGPAAPGPEPDLRAQLQQTLGPDQDKDQAQAQAQAEAVRVQSQLQQQQSTGGQKQAASAASTGPAMPAITETSSGGVFRGAPADFEGDVNPRTGEVGGPKTEPLRWGPTGDYSYNGRATDF